MADYRDPRKKTIRSISLTRSDSTSITGLGAAGVADSGSTSFPIEMALTELRGALGTDRVSLSLEAQVILMEMRQAFGKALDSAGQMFSNIVTKLKVAAGRFLKVEPFGGYGLYWGN